MRTKRLAVSVAIVVFSIFAKTTYAQAPQINTGGVVNGASFASSGIAPGSIATVFGTNFGSSMTGVTVQIGGVNAPLYSVSPTQINFQVPWELAGRTFASMTVTVGDLRSNAETVFFADYGPGIFVANAANQGAVVLANTSSIAAPSGTFPGAQPVAPGQFISIFCTGLGPVTNQPATGVPASSNQLSSTTTLPIVTIGGFVASVAFAGLAPGFSGLYQVNVRVPPGVVGSDIIVLGLSIGIRQSNFVYIAVAPSALPKPAGPSGGNVQTIAVDPRNSNNVYAGTIAGVFKSTNGGATWMASNGGLAYLLSSTSVLTVDASNPSTLYAGTQEGIFKSTDGGVDWLAANNGLPGPRVGPDGILANVLALVVDPSNSATVYAVVASRATDLSTNFGSVFKSTNGGTNWSLASGSGPTTVESLILDPVQPKTLYAGTIPGGVFKSTDGAATWTSVNFTTAPTDIPIMVADPRNSGTIYAVARNDYVSAVPNMLTHFMLARGTDSGIFKSTDGGATWKSADGGIPTYTDPYVSIPHRIDIQSLAIDPANPSNLYAGVAANTQSGIFKSTNGGSSWTFANSGLAIPGTVAVVPQSLTVDPSNPETVYAATSGFGIFKSIDGAVNWNGANSGLTMAVVSSLIVDPAANVYAVAGNGVFKSMDRGASWTSANLSASTVTVDSKSNVYAGVGPAPNAVFKSADGGASWKTASSGMTNAYSGQALAVAPSDPNIIYAGTNDAGVFKSTDGGASWVAVNTGCLAPEQGSPAPGLPITGLTVAPSDPAVVYATGAFASCYTTDGGNSWQEFSVFGLSQLSPVPLAIDPITTSTIYIGTASNGIFKSTAGGQSWTPINTGIPSNASISALAIDPTNNATIYAASVRPVAVFKTTNGGQSWLPASFGPSSAVRSLAIDPTNPQTIYAGALGVFKSTDGGANWQPTGSQ
jgi:uncharacterized protein (TIGR03437 family)